MSEAGGEASALATLREKIAAHVAAEEGVPVEVRALEPLAGGACQDNWRVELALGQDAAPRRFVLRSDSRTSLPGSLDRAGELEVVRAAVKAGVRTPEARWPARELIRPGTTAYFLDWVDGEAIGRRVVKAPQLAAARERLAEELASELGRIHSITPARAPKLFDRDDAPLRELDRHDGDPARIDPVGNLLAQLGRMLDALPEPRPALELALRWLGDHRPRGPHASEVTLVHGDFRVGNFLVAPDGLRAVLDWEFARWGTPAEDLAWIAVRDWRFGRLDRPIGGIARREPFYAAYERASGRTVDRAEVHFWEVLGNVRWAEGSLQQGQRYQAGDRDLELIAVARRAQEMEWEALRLIAQGERGGA